MEPWNLSIEEASNGRRVVRFGDTEIFYEFDGDVRPPPVANLDFAVIAVIFRAMKQRTNLHVRGPVSTVLLRNIEELQNAWSCWKPKAYSPIAITVEKEVDNSGVPVERKGVFAYSGGVDSSFALLRHMYGEAGRRAVKPVTAVIIHGFEIPLDKSDVFGFAVRNARAVLGKLGIPLATVRTNWRRQVCSDWEAEFGACLASSLHQFSSVASVGVIGADEDYSHLEFPWGSNPITNPMLSGADFEILTEGGRYTRTDRVNFISSTPDVAASLRVCWEGLMTGRNCGRCEKCIRTKLNFMAAAKAPVCFDRPPTLSEIVGLRVRNPIQLGYLTDILQAAINNGISDPWAKALQVCVWKGKAELAARYVKRRMIGLAGLNGGKPRNQLN
jgi:hypothetical protein